MVRPLTWKLLIRPSGKHCSDKRVECAIKRDVKSLELRAEPGRVSLDGETGRPVTVSSLTDHQGNWMVIICQSDSEKIVLIVRTGESRGASCNLQLLFAV